MLGLGLPELIIIALILLLLFGATRLPKLARSLGESAGELKKGLEGGIAKTEQREADEAKKPAPREV
ncbi:MAG: hypothetical protein JWM81_302 [Candidatus Saccharibacteria bacterium]|nr:hypothetical protein [Candidatus Saccharibacteria bacterium]